jgi:hypothetical protein
MAVDAPALRDSIKATLDNSADIRRQAELNLKWVRTARRSVSCRSEHSY